MTTMNISEVRIALAMSRVFITSRTMSWEEVEAFTKRIGLVWHEHVNKEHWKYNISATFEFKDAKQAEDLASAIIYYHAREPMWSINYPEKKITITSAGYNA